MPLIEPSHPTAPRVDPPAASHESGFTLIEVIVAALMVGLLAMAAVSVFVPALDASGSQRIRSEAQDLAQQNENRLRGLDVDELSNLNQTLPTVALNGTQFTVQETATYITDSTGTPSCTNPSADYLETTSTVSWDDMNGAPPEKVTGLLTPTIGSVNPQNGTLAISVVDAGGNGISGATVQTSGPSSLSGTTNSAGCLLFGNVPSGQYTVDITPSSGTYVDGQTGQTVTTSSPDVSQFTVTAGSTASSSDQVELAPGGAASFSFTDAFPSGVKPAVAPTATAQAVALLNNAMELPSYRLCAAADAACPAVGQADTSFGSWTSALTATPLFPYTYSAYAGVCSSDAPTLYGSTDRSVAVKSGATTKASAITLPSIVLRLYTGRAGAAGSEEAVPPGAQLTLTDTGCALQYVGYTSAQPTLAAHQAALPLNTAYGSGVNDVGLLRNPGMPWGQYAACYSDGKGNVYQTTFSNKSSGEIVPLYAGSATTGTCP